MALGKAMTACAELKIDDTPMEGFDGSAGIVGPQDFKSCVSTNSTTRPTGKILSERA